MCKLEDNNILSTLVFISNHKNLIDEDDDFFDLVKEIYEKKVNSIIIDEKDSYPKFALNFLILGFYDFYHQIS